MNYDDARSEPSELDELLSAMCDGRLTESQGGQLDALLRSDPAARQEYLRYMHLQASLFRILRMPEGVGSPDDARWMHHFLEPTPIEPDIHLAGDDVTSPGDTLGLDDALITAAIRPIGAASGKGGGEDPDDYTLPPVQSIHEPTPYIASGRAVARKRISRRLGVWWATAAALALAVGVVWWGLRGGRDVVAGQPFAVVRAAVDARWTDAAPNAAGALPAHTPLALASGYVQLDFAHGGSMVIEAPARFTIESPGAMSVAFGKVTATVVGGGFVVDTPSAVLTDLGTAFGVEVDSQHRTYLEVFQGRVQADAVTPAAASGRQATVPQIASRQIVTASQAVNIPADGSAIQPASARPLAFVRQSQFAALQNSINQPNPAFIRWQAFSEKLSNDPSLVAYYPFQRRAQSPDELPNAAQSTHGQNDGLIEHAAWGAGRFAGKDALAFNGNDSSVKVDLPRPMTQMTLALWMNLQTPTHALNAFLTSDDLDKKSGILVEVGGRGGLNFGISNASANGTTQEFTAPDDAPLMTPGQWRFITLAFDASSSDPVRWYVDGVRVHCRNWGNKPLPIVIGSARIGSYAAAPGSDRPQRTFHGRIDELAIFSRVLGDQEIEAMYHAGAPATVH